MGLRTTSALPISAPLRTGIGRVASPSSTPAFFGRAIGRKTMLTLATLLLVFCSAIPAQSRSFYLVTEAWPPYVYVHAGQPAGADFEIVRAVFRQLGHDIHLEFLPWKRCLSMVKEGEADALLDMVRTPDREAYLLFPSEHLSTSNYTLFYLTSKPITYRSVDDLSGLVIGTRASYSYSELFDNATHFIKEPVHDVALNIRKLMAGRIDAFVANEVLGERALREHGLEDRISHTQRAISSDGIYIGFSRKRCTKDFVAAYDRALRDFKKKPEFAQIRAKYGLPAAPLPLK